MNGHVNPNEPWRPMEARIPPPLHASRPWRPPPPPPARRVEEPPFVEPVNTPPRTKPPERPKPAPGRTRQPSTQGTPISQWAAFAVICLLGMLCLDSVDWLRGTHVPRLIALGTSAGIFTGMAFSQRRSWYARLRGLVIALALAGMALWFIPTLHGVSLWSAYRLVEELRVLPAGDVAGYQRGAETRRTLVEEFPSFSEDIRTAEQAWFRRTVDEAIEQADRQLEKDPLTAFAGLRRLNEKLKGLEHYPKVRKDLEAARLRAMLASAKAVQQQR